MSYPTPEVAMASFDRMAEIAIALAPSLAMLIGLLLVQLVCMAAMAAPGIWMTYVVVRGAGWRGAAFMGLLWSCAWRLSN